MKRCKYQIPRSHLGPGDSQLFREVEVGKGRAPRPEPGTVILHRGLLLDTNEEFDSLRHVNYARPTPILSGTLLISTPSTGHEYSLAGRARQDDHLSPSYQGTPNLMDGASQPPATVAFQSSFACILLLLCNSATSTDPHSSTHRIPRGWSRQTRLEHTMEEQFPTPFCSQGGMNTQMPAIKSCYP